ncbi:MAG: hypothetical protein GX594_04930, partial [Pirellulaceae bacterium]|nr:hypothetical protein [Pirellulaceae bacterium]
MTNRIMIQSWIGLLALAFSASAASAQYRTAMEQARDKMVDEEIVAAGVKNEQVIRAMRETPR